MNVFAFYDCHVIYLKTFFLGMIYECWWWRIRVESENAIISYLVLSYQDSFANCPIKIFFLYLFIYNNIRTCKPLKDDGKTILNGLFFKKKKKKLFFFQSSHVLAGVLLKTKTIPEYLCSQYRKLRHRGGQRWELVWVGYVKGGRIRVGLDNGWQGYRHKGMKS